MSKHRLGLLFAALLALSVPANSQTTAEGKPWEDEARSLLLGCGLRPATMAERVCEAETAGFVRDYVAAMSGNFAAQRNTAFMLTPAAGRMPADDPRLLVRGDAVQGCAWWLVVAEAGSARATITDARNAQAACDRLPTAEKALARIRADQIAREIAGRPPGSRT